VNTKFDGVSDKINLLSESFCNGGKQVRFSSVRPGDGFEFIKNDFYIENKYTMTTQNIFDTGHYHRTFSCMHLIVRLYNYSVN